MPKKYPITTGFDKQYGKHAQASLKSALQYLYHIHLSRPKKLSCKNCLLLRSQIFWLLLKVLATDSKDPLLNRDTLMKPIQIQLSHIQKFFSHFLAEFLKSRLNFGHFEKRYDAHSFCISEMTDSKNVVK